MLTLSLYLLLLAFPLSGLSLSESEISACQNASSILIATCSGQSAQLDALDIFCPQLDSNLPLFESLLVDVGKIADTCLVGADKEDYDRLIAAINDDGHMGIYEKLCGCEKNLKQNVGACDSALAEYEKKGCPDLGALQYTKVSGPPPHQVIKSGNPSKDLLEFLPTSDTCNQVTTQRRCTYQIPDYEGAGFCPTEANGLSDHCLAVLEFETLFKNLCSLEQFVTNSLSGGACKVVSPVSIPDRVPVPAVVPTNDTTQTPPPPAPPTTLTRASLSPTPSCSGLNSTTHIHHPTTADSNPTYRLVEPTTTATYNPTYRLVEPTSKAYVIASSATRAAKRISEVVGGVSVLAAGFLLLSVL